MVIFAPLEGMFYKLPFYSDHLIKTDFWDLHTQNIYNSRVFEKQMGKLISYSK